MEPLSDYVKPDQWEVCALRTRHGIKGILACHPVLSTD